MLCQAEAVASKPQPALAAARGKLQLAETGVHVKRTPGLAIFYDDSIYGLPHALVELVSFQVYAPHLSPHLL